MLGDHAWRPCVSTHETKPTQGVQEALLGGPASGTGPLLAAERVGTLGTDVVPADRARLQLQPLRASAQGELVAVADPVSKVCSCSGAGGDHHPTTTVNNNWST